ncbi:hypothetical protein EVAR_6188_1 [Eumeta japonica]|uniref:Uncharacterized protein n=1 Tax=Eumeta variegata TaxID=151549 RepID=A0A4C1TH30_EUMVA|nr:hypothetical protein EVAR_6188_1 [Eumeta japonica]
MRRARKAESSAADVLLRRGATSAIFNSGYLMLVDHSRSGRTSVRDIEATKEAVENKPSTSIHRLLDSLRYSKDITHSRLKSLGRGHSKVCGPAKKGRDNGSGAALSGASRHEGALQSHGMKTSHCTWVRRRRACYNRESS